MITALRVCRRFRQSQAQDVLAAVLKEKLLGATYHAENSSAWAREIADEVKARLKGMFGSHIRSLLSRLKVDVDRCGCSAREVDSV